MVIGAGERHDLGRADLADRARGDDRALALHETWHRGDGADRAGVGERDGGACEVVGEQLVGARLVDQGLVGRPERGEVHPLSVLDHRDDECPAPVLLFDVHCEPQVHALRVQAVRLPFDLLERVCHDGELLHRLHHREADQMRERDLLAARGEPGVQLLAARVERIDGYFAERGRGGHGQRVRHVLGEPGGRAGDRREAGMRDGGCGMRGGGGGDASRIPHPASREHLFAVCRNHRKVGDLPVVE